MIKILQATSDIPSLRGCLGAAILGFGAGRAKNNFFRAGGARVKFHRGQILPERGKSNASQFIERTSCQCQDICEEMLVFFLSMLLLSLSTKQHFAKKKFLSVGKGE